MTRIETTRIDVTRIDVTRIDVTRIKTEEPSESITQIHTTADQLRRRFF